MSSPSPSLWSTLIQANKIPARVLLLTLLEVMSSGHVSKPLHNAAPWNNRAPHLLKTWLNVLSDTGHIEVKSNKDNGEMKSPLCHSANKRESFVVAEGERKEDSTRCNVPEVKTTHTGSQEGNKRERQNNDSFFKVSYYAPFLNRAAMLHRDGRAEFKKRSRVKHLGNPYSNLCFGWKDT